MSRDITWSEYLARGLYTTNDEKGHKYIYHMCEVERYENCDIYFPPTYKQDGFIHATAEPAFLLGVGNNFYKNVPGEWICLELIPSLLGAPVIFESPMPVGNIKSNADSTLLFPHIYGGIRKFAVNRVIKVTRNADGEFLSLDM